MELELTDQGSNSLKNIGHRKVPTNTHAVSNTEWDQEATATRLIFAQPSVRSKYRMVEAPDIRIMMKNVIRNADTGLYFE